MVLSLPWWVSDTTTAQHFLITDNKIVGKIDIGTTEDPHAMPWLWMCMYGLNWQYTTGPGIYRPFLNLWILIGQTYAFYLKNRTRNLKLNFKQDLILLKVQLSNSVNIATFLVTGWDKNHQWWSPSILKA